MMKPLVAAEEIGDSRGSSSYKAGGFEIKLKL